MKLQKGKYIKFNTSFKLTVSKELGETRFTWKPDAVYITHDHSEINLHYAGTHAGESSAIFTLPADPKFLGNLATSLVELADQYS